MRDSYPVRIDLPCGCGVLHTGPHKCLIDNRQACYLHGPRPASEVLVDVIYALEARKAENVVLTKDWFDYCLIAAAFGFIALGVVFVWKFW